MVIYLLMCEGINTMHKFIILGNPITKKNSSRIVIVGGKPRILPSTKYLEFEKYASVFLKPLKIDYPVNIQCIYYMSTKRKVDLTNLLSATMDILVKYNVVVDDNRNIVFSNDGSKVLYSKDNPRTEIEITSISHNVFESWEVSK